MHFFSDQMKLTAEDTVHVSKSSECRNIRFLEHVQVRVNLEVWPRGDLLLTLESPSKTFSRLTQYRLLDRLRGYSTNLTDWVILTLHHWGEDPQGSWKLRAELGSGGNVTLPILLIWKFVIISFCTHIFLMRNTALLSSNFCLIVHVRMVFPNNQSSYRATSLPRENNGALLSLEGFLSSLKCRCVSQSTENLVPFGTVSFVFHVLIMKHQFLWTDQPCSKNHIDLEMKTS